MPPASYATDARRSRGRRYPEPAHPYRDDYARDRDRVIHSRAFRRLEAKTQVFTTRFSDHFRNRLTHTLEVAQIARTVAGDNSLTKVLVTNAWTCGSNDLLSKIGTEILCTPFM
jgi:dGTP triphosphohydrolase